MRESFDTWTEFFCKRQSGPEELQFEIGPSSSATPTGSPGAAVPAEHARAGGNGSGLIIAVRCGRDDWRSGRGRCRADGTEFCGERRSASIWYQGKSYGGSSALILQSAVSSAGYDRVHTAVSVARGFRSSYCGVLAVVLRFALANGLQQPCSSICKTK